MEALALAATWPVDHVAAVAITPHEASMLHGERRHRFRLASVSKLLTAWAVLVAVEEAVVDLDAPLDPATEQVPDGVTLRHLLAHAAGFPFDGDEPVSAPERRRIYSNTGIERAADVLARAADMPFSTYFTEAVLEPLGMQRTELVGSPAHGVWSDIGDMNLFLLELMQPTLIATSTRDEAVRPQYPDLGGIVPGVGRFQPCPWGLGFELHGDKSPHWMGASNSPRAYGHFGGSGTFLWVDPDAGVGTVALTDRPFDDWADDALRLWPQYADALLAEAAGG